LTRIQSEAFSFSSLQSIVIPNGVEILYSACFSDCESLSSLSFESNSRLTRIESKGFSDSSLRSIVIPCNVKVIDGSAFLATILSPIVIESGNETFIVQRDCLIAIRHHKVISKFSNPLHSIISADMDIICSRIL
jgi:hypothetical protein